MSDDYVDLILTLLDVFPKDWKTLAVPNCDHVSKSGKVHAFVDLSNMILSYSQCTGKSPQRIDLSRLTVILLRGREYSALVAAGSRMSTFLKQSLDSLGYQVWQGTIGPDGKEMWVDEGLSDSIIRLVTSQSAPETLVIATGDGQPSAGSPQLSFLAAGAAAARRNWTVEVYAFGDSLSRNWRHLQAQYPKNITVYTLDEFFV